MNVKKSTDATLPILERCKVYRLAKDLYVKGVMKCPKFYEQITEFPLYSGMCNRIREAYRQIYNKPLFITSDLLMDMFPELWLIKPDDKPINELWWDIKDFVIREEMFDFIINKTCPYA